MSGAGRFPLACLIVLAMLAATLLPVSHAYLHLHGSGDSPLAECAPRVAAVPHGPEAADDPCPAAPRTHADHCPLCLQLAQPVLPTACIPGLKAVGGGEAFVLLPSPCPPTGRLAWLRPAPRAPPALFS